MSKWISGAELLSRWDIKSVELFDYVRKGLRPHSILGKPMAPPNVSEKLGYLEEWEKELETLKRLCKSPMDSRPVVRMRQEKDRKERIKKVPHLEKKIKTLKEELSQIDTHSWENYTLTSSEQETRELIRGLTRALFEVANVKEIETRYGLVPKKERHSADRSAEKKLRPNQKQRIKCREVAEELWKADPTVTITAMIEHEDIVEASKRTDGNLYLEKTVRNWIKDLCPNRSPGRRPNKAKNR
jgi:hypothetical protein